MQPMTALVAGPALALSLAACVPVAGADSCGAAANAGLLGTRLAGQQIVAAGKVRVIAPGDAVTMDHLPERLNIRVDAAGIVTALDCG